MTCCLNFVLTPLIIVLLVVLLLVPMLPDPVSMHAEFFLCLPSCSSYPVPCSLPLSMHALHSTASALPLFAHAVPCAKGALNSFFLRTVRTCLILCIGSTMGTVCLFANVAGIAYPLVEACLTNDATTIRTCERACATFTFTSNPKHPEASIACLSLPNFLHFTAVKTLLHIRGFVPGILSDECLEYLVTHPPPV